MATRQSTIGDAVREERLRLEMTQEQLAHQISVSLNTIKNWENGRSQPRHDELERLSELFEWTLPWASGSGSTTRVYLNASLARDLVNRPDALFGGRQRPDSDEFLEAVR